MNNELVKPAFAELIGTFVLVFAGIFVAGIAGDQGVIVPALGHGLAVMSMAYVFGHISGTHINPAVTLGLLVGRKIGIDRAVIYWIAQIIGALVAAVVANVISPGIAAAGQTRGSLTDTALGSAGLFEAILTFFLVSIVYQAAVYGKAGNVAGLAIGLTLAMCILAGGTFTGASLNPARTLGPAVVAGDLSYVPVYIIATLIGGAAAGALHAYFFDSREA